jgi:hypothetical protein
MSGPAGSQHWMYNAGGSFYDYSIENSVRMSDADNTTLQWTAGTPSSTTTWTMSVWMKKYDPAGGQASQEFFSAGTSGSAYSFFSFQASQYFTHQTELPGARNKLWYNRVFRDPSAWFHVVLRANLGESTQDDRLKLYINGELQTSTSDGVSQTSWSFINANTVSQNWGGKTGIANGNPGCDFYLADINFCDGQSYAPTEFGETKNGVWIPKDPSVTYGNNGYRLEFKQTGTGGASATTIGADTSGNDNHFTDSGFASTDVVSDSPTNNFATFNPLDQSSTTLTYSEGNLKAERTSSSFAQAYSNFSFDSGKWYAEFLLDTGNSGVGVIAGTTNPGSNRYLGQDSYTYSYYFDGRKVNSASYTSYGDSYTTAADGSGDVVGVYIDADNGNIYFSKNGTVQNSGTAAFTGVTGPFRFAIASESNCFHIANFGQDDSFAGLKTSGSAAASDDNGNGVFYDAIGLSGYLAPCTANLPEPAIGPNSDTQADDNFNTVLWSGNSTNNRSITTGHATDFVWIKKRGTTVQSHVIADTVRGTSDSSGTGNVGILASNLTNAESTNSSDSGIASFDSTGFTIGAGSNTANADAPYQGTNASSHTYVGWSWKAGGTAASNTSGSITSSVSANQDAGMSIVSYEATGSNATVGHGLSAAPELIIIKERDNANGWAVSIKGDPTDFLRLDATTARSDDAAVFNDTAPTSTVFSIGTAAMVNRDSMIAYCFHSVDGYSKVGSYVGNGSADGTFVYTGFRPAFLILRRIDSGNNWHMFDNKRDTFNVVDANLYPNLTNVEATGTAVDFLSNGFKNRNSAAAFNASGGTYIYLAFAEAPFKYANAR